MQANEQLLLPPARGAWLGWLMAATLLAAAIYLGLGATQLAEQADSRQAAVATARAQLAHKPAPVASRAAVEDSKRWAALAAERGFSWYPLFRALEQSSSPDIELLEFVPDKANGRLTLRGEARSLTALTEYLSALGAQDALTEVYLARQKRRNRAGMVVLEFEVRTRLTR